jgi:hypothetical protein
MGAPPNWLLWMIVGWYAVKLAWVLFVLGAACWNKVIPFR